MSKQGKTQPQASAGNSPVPGAVAQQAQQYLEQNIMAWMQPKPQMQQMLTSVGPNQKHLQEHMTQTSPRHMISSAASGSGAYPPGSPRFGGVAYVAPSVAGTSCIGVAPSSCIPHSLSFSGYSHHSLMQGTSFSSPCPSIYGTGQPSAAASFFARAAQKLNLSSRRRRRQHHALVNSEPPPFRTNFCDILRVSAPPVPPTLLRSVGRKDSFAIGKVKVMLRIAPGFSTSCEASSFLNVEGRKKQVTIYDPSNSSCGTVADRRTAGISAPKMFAFDAIFSPDDTQTEVCSSSLPEVIQAVIGGTDGCLFVYGQSKLGKTHTMVGSSDSVQGLGAIPCAISWLFRMIHEQRQKTGARFSVRISALEISGKNEVLTDLLSEYAAGTENSGTSPGVYLKDDPVFGAQLINQSELRAPTPEKAGYLLDAALAARNTDGDDEGKNSHFLFTLHVYQYRVERSGKGGVAGGRSRLHLFDLGSCEKNPLKSRDGVPGSCLSLSALGNVILALFNGQKHLPYKDSKLTQVLREATSSLTCRVAMIAHVSCSPHHYSEILGTIQLASRIHRMRRKKFKGPNNVNMEVTYDEKGVCVRPYIRMHADESMKAGGSDQDYTSSSEQSCDTVIYVGGGRVPLNLTDNERPPLSIPVISKSSKAESSDKGILNSSSTHNNQEHPKSMGTPSKSQGSILPNKEDVSSKSSKDDRLPASTQTPRAEASKGSMGPSQKKKHRPSQVKQENVAPAAGCKDQQTAVKASGTTKEKLQSDEMWIDGPRFSKPKFDSKTLHRLQKEQWVDGPPVIYGFMDDHKQSMIRRWVEDHTSITRGSPGEKKSNNEERERKRSNTFSGESQAKDARISSYSSTEHKKGEPEYAVPYRPASKKNDSLGPIDNVEDSEQDDLSCQNFDSHNDLNHKIDDTDSASNSAEVDEIDNEENTEASGFDPDLYPLQMNSEHMSSHDLDQCPSESNIETIEIDEPEESVPMVDCCLQVNEEDIIAETWLQSIRRTSHSALLRNSKNYSGQEHPLRVLSEEELNVPSSFSGSRSVSIDLDSISVPDTCRDFERGKGGLTWRLLYGNMFQKIKQQQLLQRKASDDIATSRSSVAESFERIAQFRKMMHPLNKNDSQLKSPVKFPTFRTKSYMWPSDASCNALSEMVCDSSDSSVEDLSAVELNSAHSEPADLDLEKYDFKFNVKPMNGLKLEAFYNKIHKVPPFTEQFGRFKPTQTVAPLISDEENKQLLEQLEIQRMDNLGKERSNSFSHRPPIKSLRQNIESLDQGFSTFQRKYSFSSLSRLEATSVGQFSDNNNGHKNSCNDINRTESKNLLNNPSKISVTNLRAPPNDLNDVTKENEHRKKAGGLTYKNIDTSQLTVGQSPTNSSKLRSSRVKVGSKDSHSSPSQSKSSNSSIRTKDSLSSSPSSRTTSRSNLQTNSMRQNCNKNVASNCCPGGSLKGQKSLNNGCNKPTTRTSPTSNGSSTSGVVTCCSTMKAKEKVPSKGKPSDHSKQKQNCRADSKRQQRTKSICRSTSSPSTCVDSGDTVMTDVTDSERYYVTRHASVSNTLTSPYHKVPDTLVIPHAHHRHRHQRTSSGHGSDSSMNSLEPREAKDLLLKGTKTQQFSGTSSGYESMLRDSEGTPLSSSQESGTEASVDKGERGRKGRRKSQGSSKRSLSAPARSPPSPTSPHQIGSAVDQQPTADASLLRRGDRSLRRSDEEVCCPSLLCCRLLDFY